MQCFKSVASPTGTLGIINSCVACSKIKPAESLNTACCVPWVRPICFDDHKLTGILFDLYNLGAVKLATQHHAMQLGCYTVSTAVLLCNNNCNSSGRRHDTAFLAQSSMSKDSKRCVLDRVHLRNTFSRIQWFVELGNMPGPHKFLQYTIQSTKVVLGCAMHSKRCISAVLQYIRNAAQFSSTLILHNVSLPIDSVVLTMASKCTVLFLSSLFIFI